jgi:hypothetical protein
MQFINPTILWGLLALAIPVIIHLFYFRRYKKIPFSNTAFLLEAKEVQKNANRIKHLLILLCRLLAMGLIIFAFAQPYISNKQARNRDVIQYVSVFTDNSFSMAAESSNLNLLNEAKQIAIDIVNSYPQSISFHVFDHNFNTGDQHWLNKEEAIARLQATQLSGSVKTLQEINGRQEQMMHRLVNQNMRRYVISDGQKNIFSELPAADSTRDMNIILLNPVIQSNVAIDSCWFEDPILLPDAVNNLYVKLSNHSNETVQNVRLLVEYEGQNRPAGSKTIGPKSFQIDTIPLTHQSGGWKTAKVKIEDHPVTFDDELSISFQVTQQINVLAIGDASRLQNFKAVYSGNGYTKVDHQNTNKLVYSTFDNYKLIILDEPNSINSGLATALTNYISSGGILMLYPRINGDIQSYNQFLRKLSVTTYGDLRKEDMAVYQANKSSFVFRKVFRQNRLNIMYPEVKSYFSLRPGVKVGESLMKFRNDKNFLVHHKIENGALYLCAAPIDNAYSNFLNVGEFFVPFMNRIAISAGNSIKPYYTIGSEQAIVLKQLHQGQDPVYKISGTSEFIPAKYNLGKNVLLYPKGNVTEQGIFELMVEDSALLKVAFNYDRSESNLESFSGDDLLTSFPSGISLVDMEDGRDIKEAIIENDNGRQLWKWCIILALLFLLIEQILLRWKSN